MRRNIQQEFNRQTQIEESAGLPWQPFMRVDSTAGLAKSQNDFISFVMLPWWRALAKVVPITYQCVGLIEANLRKWTDLFTTGEVDNKIK